MALIFDDMVCYAITKDFQVLRARQHADGGRLGLWVSMCAASSPRCLLRWLVRGARRPSKWGASPQRCILFQLAAILCAPAPLPLRFTDALQMPEFWQPACGHSRPSESCDCTHDLQPAVRHAGSLPTAAPAAGAIPPKNQWARNVGGQIYILHVHGPKLDKAACVLHHADLDPALQTDAPSHTQAPRHAGQLVAFESTGRQPQASQGNLLQTAI